jgi:hypothetical protein
MAAAAQQSHWRSELQSATHSIFTLVGGISVGHQQKLLFTTQITN